MIPRICTATLALILVWGAGAAADKPTDAAIDDNVRIKLAADSEVNGGALKVEVKDGVVTITGLLETQRQKDKASKIAKRVKGVRQVVNNITLKEKTAGR